MEYEWRHEQWIIYMVTDFKLWKSGKNGLFLSVLCSRTCCALCPPPVPQSTLKICWRSRSSQRTLGWRAERQSPTSSPPHLSPVHQKGQTAPNNTPATPTAVPSCRLSSLSWALGFTASHGFQNKWPVCSNKGRNLVFLTSNHPGQYFWILGGRWPNATIENLGVIW